MGSTSSAVLLDSDTYIAVIRERPAAARGRLFAARQERRRLSVSTITVAELWRGAFLRAPSSTATTDFATLIDTLTVLPFDEDDAREAGRLDAALQRLGQRIGPYDTLIAGQALARDLTLVTGNTREFSRVEGLRLENWLS